MPRLIIALARAYRAASQGSPNTYYLICRATGLARRNGQEAVCNALWYAELNLTTSYRLGKPAFNSTANMILAAVTELQ